MSYSYAHAKDYLSESDKNRMVCMLLSSPDALAHIDWSKATAEYGAASADSMRVSFRNTLKKIETSGGKEGVEATATPKSKATPKRKKAASTTDDVEETPAKKRGRKPKAKTPTKVEDEEAAEEGKEGTMDEGIERV